MYKRQDIAYHRNKFAVRGFDKVINIWGADHHGHVARLKGAMDALGLDGQHRLDIVLMQLVKLVRDGETVRMSKRTGKAISLTDLLDEIPVDACRWFFNAKPETQMEFDLGLAVREDSENPVYYVQYAYARICTLVKALAAEGYTVPAAAEADLSVLIADEEKALIKQLAQYPAVVLLAVLVLNFAGAAAYTVLRTGERYIYDHAGAYETLGRSGFGSEQVMADIDEIEIHWLSGSVYLVESETDGVTFQEDYTGDVDDYRLRYAVEDGKLVIQPCRSRTFGSMDLPKKTLTVFLPKTRTLDAITVETVSADVELHGGQTSDLSVTTTSGEIIGPGIRAGEYDLSTVSGGVRLPSLPAAGSSIDCDTVSGYMSLGCAACPADVDFDSVSGSLTLTLPAGSQYTLAFDSVSGRIITTNFTPGTAAPCAISAETVSGDLEIRNP